MPGMRKVLVAPEVKIADNEVVGSSHPDLAQVVRAARQYPLRMTWILCAIGGHIIWPYGCKRDSLGADRCHSVRMAKPPKAHIDRLP